MRRARELIYMYTEHGDVTKPRKTLVRTRAFSGENSPPMKFTFLGTSHFLSPGDGGVGWWWKYFRGSPGFQGYCRGISHRQLSIKGCYIENDW